MDIYSFIARKLHYLNATHQGIAKVDEKDYLNRVGDAIATRNANLDKICIEVDNVEFTKENFLDEVQLPNPFKKIPVIYTSYGSSLVMEYQK